MAGDWIKWTKGLTRKPEVIQVAHRLKISRHAAAGLLMEVWEWADDNVLIDETVSGFDPDNCPGIVRLGDQPEQLFDATFDVAGLADALTAVGWIAIRSGSLTFPNFARHNGKSAKARALDSARKRTVRSVSPVGVPNVSGSEPDKTRIRGEKRRREKRPPNPPPGEGCAAFDEFWKRYPRKENKPGAFKAWKALAPAPPLIEVIFAAIDKQRRRGCLEPRTVDGRSTIPHPASWLNGHRWEDLIEGPQPEPEVSAAERARILNPPTAPPMVFPK